MIVFMRWNVTIQVTGTLIDCTTVPTNNSNYGGNKLRALVAYLTKNHGCVCVCVCVFGGGGGGGGEATSHTFSEIKSKRCSHKGLASGFAY